MPRKMINGADLNSQKIINLADGSAVSDGATVGQMQNWLNGLAFKDEVKVATTTNGTLATAFANGQTIDGQTLVTGDRVLIKNQTTQSENGIYTVNASGAPTRAVDADSAGDLNQATVKIRLGTVNANTQWTQTTDSPTVGSSNIVWSASGGGTGYVAGAGLTETSGTFAVGAGTGIVVNADDVAVNPAYAGFAKRYSANIGDGSTTAIAVAHNLGTKDRLGEPLVQVVSTGELVECDIIIGTNTDTVTFPTAPSTAQYRYSTAA